MWPGIPCPRRGLTRSAPSRWRRRSHWPDWRRSRSRAERPAPGIAPSAPASIRAATPARGLRAWRGRRPRTSSRRPLLYCDGGARWRSRGAVQPRLDVRERPRRRARRHRRCRPVRACRRRGPRPRRARARQFVGSRSRTRCPTCMQPDEPLPVVRRSRLRRSCSRTRSVRQGPRGSSRSPSVVVAACAALCDRSALRAGGDRRGIQLRRGGAVGKGRARPDAAHSRNGGRFNVRDAYDVRRQRARRPRVPALAARLLPRPGIAGRGRLQCGREGRRPLSRHSTLCGDRDYVRRIQRLCSPRIPSLRCADRGPSPIFAGAPPPS